jgi:NTE family protein
VRACAIVVAWLACTAVTITAQDPDAVRPLRIGLVLGGGGARGGIHVGVLRVLEELRVPVHAIAGTSMGAIVGGLYATGLSAEEIEDQLRSLDWRVLFNDKPPRPLLEYRRKQDDANLLVRFEVGFRDGRFRFPAGVIATHRPNLMLKLLTLAAGGIRDFDELPIPFRAVATDIATGEMVVLSDGDLPTAILASMSIPGVFAPARIGGRLLVDGGLVRNLPVDVVRAMDVDVVIVVDAGTPLATAEDLSSAVGVYVQTVTIVTRGNADEQLRSLGAEDVIIAPPLGNIGATDFHRITQAMEIGRDAARALRDRLAPLAIPVAAFDSLRAARAAAVELPVLDFVRVENESQFDARVIEGRLTLAPGDTLDPQTLADAIDRVYGMGVFERVDFRLVEENGRNGLIVRPVEKPWGPSYLRFGLGLTDEPDGNSTFELRANFTRTRLGSRGGDLRAELRGGEVRGLLAELYQSLDWKGHWFAAPSLELVQTLADAFESNIRIAQYDAERVSLGLDVGRQFGATGQLRLGVQRRWIVAEPEIGGPELPRFNVTRNVYRTRVDIDRLDDVHFPTSGTRAHVLVEHARAADSFPSYTRIDAGLLGVRSAGPHTVMTGLDIGTSLGSTLPLYEEFELGGFLQLSGLRRRQVAGRYRGLGRLIYVNRVGDAVGLAVAGGLRAGGSIEIGNAWNDAPSFARRAFRFGTSAFVGLETVLGPFYAAYAIGDRGRNAWYLFLGQPFLRDSS